LDLERLAALVVLDWGLDWWLPLIALG